MRPLHETPVTLMEGWEHRCPVNNVPDTRDRNPKKQPVELQEAERELLDEHVPAEEEHRRKCAVARAALSAPQRTVDS